MLTWTLFFALVSGSCLGGLTIWFISRRALDKADKKTQSAQSTLQATVEGKESLLRHLDTQLKDERQFKQTLQEKVSELERQLASETARREEEQKAAREKIEILQEAEKKLSNTFKGLSSDALQNNNQSFLDLAKTTMERFQKEAQSDLQQRQEVISRMVQPIEESLKSFNGKIHEIEKSRVESFSGLNEQIKNLSQTHTSLQKETANLVTALRKPGVRGSWGELQLRRAVEFAGMVERCDFIEQEASGDEDLRLRPDMIVNLPNDRRIIIDAKTPMESYLKVLETEDLSEQELYLKNHARQLRDRIKELSLKKYWQQFDPTPEFVVLFLPNEALFSVALEKDPELIDFGAKNKIILSTPTTLIALLKAIAYGWQQEKIAEHARQISDLGCELYERLGVFATHFSSVGKNLDRAVDAYNKAVRSVETRVLITARKFKEMSGATQKGIPHLRAVDNNTFDPQSEELQSDELNEAVFLADNNENGFKNN